MAVASVNKIDKIDCNNNLLNVKVERRECVEWIAIVDSIISGNITMPPEDLCAVAKQCESNNCSGDDVCRSVISNHSNKQRVHDDIIWQTEKMMMKNTTISLLNKTKNLAHEAIEPLLEYFAAIALEVTFVASVIYLCWDVFFYLMVAQTVGFAD